MIARAGELREGVGGRRYAICTLKKAKGLWTDFEVEMPEHDANFAMWYADRSMSDFALIRYRGALLHAIDTREMHFEARAWLSDRLAETFEGRTEERRSWIPLRMLRL